MTELLYVAARELVDTAAFYEERRPGYGLRFLDEAEELLDFIDAMPLAGPRWLLDGIPEGVRHVMLKTFPVSIVYVTDPRVVVVAIMGSQEPTYWVDRLGAIK